MASKTATKPEKSPAKNKKAAEVVEEALKKTKRSAKSKEIVDEAIADAKEDSKKYYSPADDIDDLLDSIEKKYGLSSSLVDRDEKRLSTGLLALDLLLNGGIVGGGWYTIFGGEQSCKSTLTMTLLCMIQNAIEDLGRKIAASIFDYEGSSDIEYIGNMMEVLGLKGDAANIFGVRDDDTGNWMIKPKVRYYMPDSGEEFFRYVSKIKRALPDVQKIGDHYWYIYEHTVENKKKFAGQYDTKYLTKSNKIRIPAPDGFMQAVSIVDSYVAMLPDRLDDDDSNEAMAEQARMFAAGIKKIRSGMRKKRITVFGVNQLRLRPAVMHQNPEYEPGGEALKFFSDVRIKSTSRGSAPYGFVLDKGIMEENSVTVPEGKDIYRFIVLKTIKNKLGGIPNREVWARVWITDGDGRARGFDPVFDTFEYLKQLGYVDGTRNNLKFHPDVPLHGAKKLSFEDFKILVLGTKKQITEVCERVGLKKAGNIRSWCANHCASGKGPKRYKDQIVKRSKEKIDTSDE